MRLQAVGSMGGGDWLSTLQTIIAELLSGKSAQFMSVATVLITGFATIRLVLIGIRWMLSGQVDFLALMREIILIGAAQAMLRGYAGPMYAGGKVLWDSSGFVGMVQKGPQQLAQAIGADAFKELSETFNSYTENNPPALGTIVSNFISYLVIRMLIEVTRFAMFFAMSWGFVVQAVLILIGPVFIPFLLFDPLSFMFWGWLRCFIQYSFYPVIGAALVHVFSMLLIHIWASPAVAMSGYAPMAIIPYLLLSIVGMLAGPSLVSQIFSGNSGGSTLLGAVIGRTISKGIS
jgi:hypothetical protein